MRYALLWILLIIPSFATGIWQQFEGTNLGQYRFLKPIDSTELLMLKRILESRPDLKIDLMEDLIESPTPDRVYFRLGDGSKTEEFVKILGQLDGRQKQSLLKIINLQYTSSIVVAEFLQNLNGQNTRSKESLAYSTSVFMHREYLKVVSDPASNTIVLDGPAALVEKAVEVIRELDTRTPQVLVEVLISEISLNEDDSLGLEWNFTGQGAGGQNVQNEATANFGNMGVLPNQARQALEGLKVSILNPADFEFFLSSLSQKNRISVVSRPKILTANNKPAEFKATQRNPVLKTTNADGVVNSSVDYIDIGVTLEVTPRINRDNFVDLGIRQIIQEIVGFDRNALNSPIYSERMVRTNVLVKDNHTLIIGGLISETDVEGISKIPILSQIPLLKEVFQRRTRDKTKTELMIFLTPHILRDNLDAERATQRERDDIASSELIKPYFTKNEEYRKHEADRTQAVGKIVKVIAEQGRVWIDVPNPDTVKPGSVFLLARHLEDLIREGTNQWIGQDYESLAYVTILGSVSDSVWIGELQDRDQIAKVSRGDLVHKSSGANMIDSDVKSRAEQLSARIELVIRENALQVDLKVNMKIRNVDTLPMKKFVISDGTLSRSWKFYQGDLSKRLPAIMKPGQSGRSSRSFEVILPTPLQPGETLDLLYAGPLQKEWQEQMQRDKVFKLNSSNTLDTIYDVWLGDGVELMSSNIPEMARLVDKERPLYRWYKPREKFNLKVELKLKTP